MQVIDRDTAIHYLWQGDCDGWHVTDTPDLSVILERMPPDRSETAHRHARARQVFHCLTGTLCIATPDQVHVLHPGQSLTVPPGVWHRAHSHVAVEFIVISAPSTRGDREDRAGTTL